MAQSTKYGRVDIPGIPEQEPVFILRAQDGLALPTILKYLSFVQGLRRPNDETLMSQLRSAVERFTGWPGTRKLPD